MTTRAIAVEGATTVVAAEAAAASSGAACHVGAVCAEGPGSGNLNADAAACRTAAVAAAREGGPSAHAGPESDAATTATAIESEAACRGQPRAAEDVDTLDFLDEGVMALWSPSQNQAAVLD